MGKKYSHVVEKSFCFKKTTSSKARENLLFIRQDENNLRGLPLNIAQIRQMSNLFAYFFHFSVILKKNLKKMNSTIYKGSKIYYNKKIL